MKRSHVTDEGEKVCVASTPDKCRAIFNGEPAPHFRSMKEGQEFYLTYLETENSNSMKNKTQRKLWNSEKLSTFSHRLPTSNELGFPDRAIEPSEKDPNLWWGGNLQKDASSLDGDAFAIQHQNETIANLPPNQRSALAFYMSYDFDNYRDILDYVRGFKRFEKEDKEYFDDVVKNIDVALAENNTGEERILYRGVAGNFAEDCLKLPVGSKIAMPGFTSTSPSQTAASIFTDTTFLSQNIPTDVKFNGKSSTTTAGIYFEMKTDKGMYLAGAEHEHLLPRDTNWIVVGKRLTKIDGMKQDSVFIQLIDADLFETEQVKTTSQS